MDCLGQSLANEPPVASIKTIGSGPVTAAREEVSSFPRAARGPLRGGRTASGGSIDSGATETDVGRRHGWRKALRDVHTTFMPALARPDRRGAWCFSVRTSGRERYGSREGERLRGRPRGREDARGQSTRRAQPHSAGSAGDQKGRRDDCSPTGFRSLLGEAALGAVAGASEQPLPFAGPPPTLCPACPRG
jgi:hypothetical protein